MMSAYLPYMIILGVGTLIGKLVGGRLKSKFKHYSQIPTQNGKSGAEIAHEMLSHFGINDVKIIEGRGSLTDHYNPATKTIALSPEVYSGRHISAGAVAAHECGHAVQHAEAYSMLTMRSKLVPAIGISGKIQSFLMMFAMGGLAASVGGSIMLTLLTITFGVTALFALVTLPVEFDASRRALVWLDASGNAMSSDYEGAKDALWWAAMTYVAAALSALAMFLYFAIRLMNSRNN